VEVTVSGLAGCRGGAAVSEERQGVRPGMVRWTGVQFDGMKSKRKSLQHPENKGLRTVAVGSHREAPLLEKKYRISGHESFPCRYTWLPKAVRTLTKSPRIFANEEQAMVELGVGKNMVRSIRFWSQAAGIVRSDKQQGYSVTKFGSALLGAKGQDPFLEDIRTLWLIHWKLATNSNSPLLAWDYLLNRWQEPELMAVGVLKALQKECVKADIDCSTVTLEQHFDTFLHTYIPTRGRKGEVQEDNLDCPLVELELIVKVGDREVDSSSGKREAIYAFRRDEKPDITPELFAYCLDDFWEQRHTSERTLPFREVAHGHGSPGQIFKLPEEDIRVRLGELEKHANGYLTFSESASQQLVHKHANAVRVELLQSVYSVESVDA
jgi:Protein of unknown function (DUF4007)